MGDEKISLLVKHSDTHSGSSVNYGSKEYTATGGTQYLSNGTHLTKRAADYTQGPVGTPSPSGGEVKIERTMGLSTTILMMVNCCCGSGIFVTPVGVTASVGSVGLSLIVWAFCGLYSMVLALCYAEVGTAIPRAGGDFTYLEVILGPLPAFLSLWLMLIIMAPLLGAVFSRTTAEYLSNALDLEYDSRYLLICSIFLVVSVTVLSYLSTKWSNLFASALTMSKVAAMVIIIVAGFTQLGQGWNDNLANVWEGSNFSAVAIIFGIVPGFVSYGGWDCVNSMAEDMKNPKRDIPIVATAGVLGVTAVYTLINLAYFIVLTPEQFISSSAVASSFSSEVFPGCTWLVPVFVMISTLGSLLSVFLFVPRVALAGGRSGQIPHVFSFLHTSHHTAVPALIFQSFLTLCYCTVGMFVDLVSAMNMLSVLSQLKVVMVLIALIYMKRRRQDLKGTIQVPLIVVLVCLAMMLVIIGVSLYTEPVLMTGGVALFLLGIPLYYLKRCCEGKSPWAGSDDYVRCLQLFLSIVPESDKKMS